MSFVWKVSKKTVDPKQSNGGVGEVMKDTSSSFLMLHCVVFSCSGSLNRDFILLIVT